MRLGFRRAPIALLAAMSMVVPFSLAVELTESLVGVHLPNVICPLPSSSEGDCEDWIARYNGPAGRRDYPHDVAASRDGARVYFTGETEASGGRPDFALVAGAFDAGSGALLWASLHDGPAHSWDMGDAVTESPEGARIFVTGHHTLPGPVNRAIVLCLDAVSGAQLWVIEIPAPDGFSTSGKAIMSDPAGERVFISIGGAVLDHSFGVAAVAATSGDLLWVTYTRDPADDASSAEAVAVSSAGDVVYATGFTGPSVNPPENLAPVGDFLTVAYDAATGAERWRDRAGGGPVPLDDHATDLAVSPDGTRLYVTGDSWKVTAAGLRADPKFMTIAYEAGGGRVWSDQTIPGHEPGLALSPDGARVYVGGRGLSGSDLVAYEAGTGVVLWVSSGPSAGVFLAWPAMSPDGAQLFLAGAGDGGLSNADPESGDRFFSTGSVGSALGQPQWEANYKLPVQCNCFVRAIAVGAGRVFVAGEAQHPQTGLDMTILSYYAEGPG